MSLLKKAKKIGLNLSKKGEEYEAIIDFSLIEIKHSGTFNFLQYMDTRISLIYDLFVKKEIYLTSIEGKINPEKLLYILSFKFYIRKGEIKW